MDNQVKQKLKTIEKEININPFLRALLLTDGSITILLEAFTNREIKISGLKQKIIKADEKLSDELKVDLGEKLNEREVILLAGENPLIYAKSYAVILRLDICAKNDILKTNAPIGKILKKHKVETHREIQEIGLKSDAKIAEILNLSDDKILFRSYVIIQRNMPLMKIEEYFGEI